MRFVIVGYLIAFVSTLVMVVLMTGLSDLATSVGLSAVIAAGMVVVVYAGEWRTRRKARRR